MKVWYIYNFFDSNKKKQLYHRPELCDVLKFQDSSAILSRGNGQIFADGLMYLVDYSKCPLEEDAVNYIKSYLGRDSEAFLEKDKS
jgi:hypothetical protein